MQLSSKFGSGINSTFPLQILNFTFIGEGNSFNNSPFENDAISIPLSSSDSSFPFNICFYFNYLFLILIISKELLLLLFNFNNDKIKLNI